MSQGKTVIADLNRLVEYIEDRLTEELGVARLSVSIQSRRPDDVPYLATLPHRAETAASPLSTPNTRASPDASGAGRSLGSELVASDQGAPGCDDGHLEVGRHAGVVRDRYVT